jgi:hypothetical protein
MAGMKHGNYLRRLAIALLVAVILFAAMAHGGNGAQLAIIAPLLLCFGVVVSFAAPRAEDRIVVWVSPLLPAFSSRPPPIR